jgi:hypothetical protein
MRFFLHFFIIEMNILIGFWNYGSLARVLKSSYCIETKCLSTNYGLLNLWSLKLISLTSLNSVGFEIFTAVIMKSIIFWDMTPCSRCVLTYVSVEHITAIFRVEVISSAKPNKRYVPQKRWLKLNGLHGVISQKMILLYYQYCLKVA